MLSGGERKMKLIIDTDPGVDDAMAFFYAHGHEKIDLIALTTVFGNVTTDDATKNALWLSEFSGASCPVYAGAKQPLKITPNEPSDYVHGPHGFGTYEIGPVKGSAANESAADYLVRAAREMPGEITLCAIGPLTNVALAIEKDPDFISNLAQLVIMGGSLEAGGNVSDYAEANFWNDPHAADIVTKAPGEGRIVIVGLDVTSQIEFHARDFEGLTVSAPQTGSFLHEIGQFYMSFYKSKTGRMSCHMHDPTAIIASLAPEFLDMEEVALRVVTEGEQIGMMQRRDEQAGRTCFVCMGVDVEGVLADYKRTLANCK